ncbi:hypothetical protein CSB45_14040 [candidate division KSB3 bacterium]|uniref:Uncharacterized protein n=1 Tax=candidate division KSB3 bacterium TaxID=2044937 RepID=A0A2G6E171_9BACT|nr:MAG: hypothetical protein CSB45_14040 [candidate division KSB3 bacterium]PIE28446.1 MAG: hypothetical protein CSA57_13685 [candidate division KSB3 bacterium]
MEFGKLRINPLTNPAILDTGTWSPQAAWHIIDSLDTSYWRVVLQALVEGNTPPQHQDCRLYQPSQQPHQGMHSLLAEIHDGQHVFVTIGQHDEQPLLGNAIGAKSLPDGSELAAFAADAAVIDKFCRNIAPQKGPRALGPAPRLGIGVRMSTSVWPGIWTAMKKYDFAANPIQNSLRELNMLEDVLAATRPNTNYLFSFGNIDEGHTGSTFEGLWVSGVLSNLKDETTPRYGADADHIMVKRDPNGLGRARRILDSARYYSFFTLDVSDILNYEAVNERSAAKAEACLTQTVQDSALVRELMAYHREKSGFGGGRYSPDAAAVGRLVGKYWRALNATQDLYDHIVSLKQGVPFDLELSIDENPPEVRTCESLTNDEELMFLLTEIRRRQLPITHIAPNFGVEKGRDYRCPGGLDELESRVRRQYQMASEQGLMLDCHSGDDLTSATRRVFGRATNGNIHFKISPSLQVLFGQTLEDLYPDHFRFWWDDTYAYAEREAEGGAAVAIESLREYKQGDDPKPSARTSLFEHFNFATVGKRDAHGQFIFRERFYELPEDFYEEYSRRVEQLLGEVAQDVFYAEEDVFL